MTDGAQAVVWDTVYKPFGEVHSITGSATLNLRFPGQYFLIESGLAYNWHRHYDPTLGRYTQPDPLEFVDGPSVYAYAWSAPTQYADPIGLASSEYSEECRQLRSDIMLKYFKLMRELSKYNPQTDAIGGFPMAGGGVTKPRGHYKEIQNLQRGIKNDIARYNKLCRNNDDDGPNCPPIPRYVDQRANQYVPEPRYPDYNTSRRWQFDVHPFPGGPYSPWFPRRWGFPGIR
jgi:RHS repeat-associated protein